MQEIYDILRYLIDLSISRKRFARISLILILFYKTRLSGLNSIVPSSPLDISISSSSIDDVISLASSSLSFAFNSLFKSFENLLDNVDTFIKLFFSEAFVIKNKEKKRDKEEKKKEKKEEEEEEIRDIKKKENKNKRF